MMCKLKPILGALLALLFMAASNPADARWLSVDPVQANPDTGENFNRYYYANNNPYKFIDPDGREASFAYNRDGSMHHHSMDHAPDPTLAKAALAAYPLARAPALLRTLGSMIRQEGRSDTKVQVEKGATRNSPDQIRTNISPKEAQANLKSNGYTRTESKDGKAVVMAKGERSYTFYGESRSTKGPSADVKINGETQVKIRFDEKIK